jgi:hypothetical protein
MSGANVLPFPHPTQKPLFEAIPINLPLTNQQWVENHLHHIRMALIMMGKTPEELTGVVRSLDDETVDGFREELRDSTRHLIALAQVLRAVRYRMGVCRELAAGQGRDPAAPIHIEPLSRS